MINKSTWKYHPYKSYITDVRRIYTVGIVGTVTATADVTFWVDNPRKVGEIRDRRDTPVGTANIADFDVYAARREDLPSVVGTVRGRRS